MLDYPQDGDSVCCCYDYCIDMRLQDCVMYCVLHVIRCAMSDACHAEPEYIQDVAAGNACHAEREYIQDVAAGKRLTASTYCPVSGCGKQMAHLCVILQTFKSIFTAP